MSKYLKLFETTSQYEAYMGGGEKILPNVSLIEETNKVEYNPYIPPRNDIIIYTAPEKLNVTWSDETATFGATIKSHTFENGVGTIEFDDSVTSIGQFAFENCINLTSITIPNSVTSIGQYAFYECSGLTSITIPDSVTTIGDYVFQKCSSLTSVTIGNSVTNIGNSAFQNCSSLTSVTIGNSVTNIGNSAFENCYNLTSIVVESSNTKYDSRDNCNAIVETATNTLILGCQNTTIPNTVTSIGEGAFDGCSGLMSVTIPNSVTSIGGGAFEHCRGLTSVTIPDSVTSIGSYAFFFCSSLISVTVEATTPPTLEYRYGEYGQFGNNASGRKIYVPSESVGAYKSASGWSTYANDIEAIPT